MAFWGIQGIPGTLAFGGKNFILQSLVPNKEEHNVLQAALRIVVLLEGVPYKLQTKYLAIKHTSIEHEGKKQLGGNLTGRMDMIPAQASPAAGSVEMAELMTPLNAVTTLMVFLTTSRTTISLSPIEKESRASGSFRSFSSASPWICFSFSGPSDSSEVFFAAM